jgi:hypothetical protein
MAFRIGVRTLGVDEDGDDITTAIAEDLASDYEPPRMERLSDSAKALQNLFHELATDSHGVDEAEFRRSSVDGRIVSASENLKSRGAAYRRGVQQLIENGKIRFEDGRYYHADAVSKSDFDDDALGSASANENPKPMASANDGTKKRGEIPYDDCI